MRPASCFKSAQLLLAGVSMLALGGISVSAQEQGVQDQDSGESIEEIIVTVERREQSLQDLAGTAAVLSGEDLDFLGVQNVTDLNLSLIHI